MLKYKINKLKPILSITILLMLLLSTNYFIGFSPVKADSSSIEISDVSCFYSDNTAWNMTRNFDYNGGNAYYKNGFYIVDAGWFRTTTGGTSYSGKVIWYNETSGTGGYAFPTGSAVTLSHQGDFITISSNGTLWYGLAGYFHSYPLDIYSSDSPFDTSSWTKEIDNYVTDTGGSMTGAIITGNDSCITVCRNGANDNSGTGIQVRRFNTSDASSGANLDFEIVNGMSYEGSTLTPCYSVAFYDSRHHATMTTWSSKWHGGDGEVWGSFPYFVSYDNGTTWKNASGDTLSTPVEYTDWDLPYNNFNTSNVEGKSHGCNIVLSPDGTPVFSTPNENDYNWIFVYNSTAESWTFNNLSNTSVTHGRSLSVGSTKDFVFTTYTETTSNDTVMIRVSDDNGETWTNGSVLYDFPDDYYVTSIEYCSPDNYDDNTGRIAVAVANETANSAKDMCTVAWLKFNLSSRQETPSVYNINQDDLVGQYHNITFLVNSSGKAWSNGSAGWQDGDQINITTNTNGTDNCTGIFISMSNFSYSSYYINITDVNITASVDDELGFKDEGTALPSNGNISLDTYWSSISNDANPFPIFGDGSWANHTIYIRFYISTDQIVAGTYVNITAANVLWRVEY